MLFKMNEVFLKDDEPEHKTKMLNLVTQEQSHTGHSTVFVTPAQNSTALFTEDSQVLVFMLLQLSSLDFQ